MSEKMSDEEKLKDLKFKAKEANLGIANTLYGTAVGGIGIGQAVGAARRARRDPNAPKPDSSIKSCLLYTSPSPRDRS